MAQAEQERRAQFLQDAAHLLVVPSPAVAAFMGSARNRVAQEAGLGLSPREYDAYRRDICGACGNVMVPGWSCQVSIRSQPRRTAPRCTDSKKAVAMPENEVARECLRCHRETLQALQPKPSRQARKSRVCTEPPSMPEVASSRREAELGVVKTANASSKQRQKTRKGGLQAMLEKNKSQTTGLGGFDLMDFAM